MEVVAWACGLSVEVRPLSHPWDASFAFLEPTARYPV